MLIKKNKQKKSDAKEKEYTLKVDLQELVTELDQHPQIVAKRGSTEIVEKEPKKETALPIVN